MSRAGRSRHPDAPAVTCAGRTLTRRELDLSTNRLARAYAERGVGVGDYVTIVLPNSIEWVQAVLAAGSSARCRSRCRRGCPTPSSRRCLALRPQALIVGRDDPRGQVTQCASGFHTGSGTVRRRAARGGVAGVEVDGVRRQHRSAQADRGRRRQPVPAAAGYPLGAQEGDINLLSVPLTHNTGFTTFAVGLVQGHHLVLMPRFEPHEFLRLVTEHRVTFLATVPTIMQRLLPVYRADPDAYDLSSIRRFWHLAAPCPPAIKQAWIDLLGPEVVWELYGGTELQALTFISRRSVADPPRLGRASSSPAR